MGWAYCKTCMVQTDIDESTGMCRSGHKVLKSRYQKMREEQRRKDERLSMERVHDGGD